MVGQKDEAVFALAADDFIGGEVPHSDPVSLSNAPHLIARKIAARNKKP
ncbi:hypothetical protein ABIA16_000902 [Sinorhizobium fredii]